MEMVSNDLISKQIFPNLSSKKEVHEFTYAKINVSRGEKKERNQNLNENTIKARMYMYGICSMFKF